MSAVVDASVLTAAFTADTRGGRARALWSGDRDLHAPALVIVETANALWKYFRRSVAGELNDVRKYLGVELPARLELHEDRDLVSNALELAVHLDHPVYDCMYLVLAVQRSEPLYTFDERLIRKLTGTRFAGVARVPPG